MHKMLFSISMLATARQCFFGTLMTTIAMTAAHAELVISEPSQNYKVALSNTQATLSPAPTEVSVIKLMQVMHIDEQITAIINGQQVASNIMKTTANQQSVGDKLNKRQRELQTKIQQILTQYMQILGEGIDETTNAETLTSAYINAAKSYYTQQEVDAQIEFYDTVIGQNILAKQPQVTAAFLQQSLPKDMDLKDTKDQLESLLPQMQQIIKDIF